MKIAYISDSSPLDIRTWSGTPYHIFRILSEKHTVVWLGEGLCTGAYWHHRFSHKNEPFFLQDYSSDISKILSDRINSGDFDIVITSVYTMVSDLDINIPLLYFSDIIYILCKGNYSSMSDELEKRAVECEGKTLRKADVIVFSSEMVKDKAVQFYNLPKKKIHVLDFGANIPEPKEIIPESYDNDICRLTFVGRDWERKGGKKLLEIFRILKHQGFRCELTIIGSNPLEEITDKDITIIPYINKGDLSGIQEYDKILRKTHFMVLPTRYDAYGILFCEASAYGVPSIAANVGGVSQPIRNGLNGFLMSSDASAEDYANKIREVYENKELYTKLRKTSRREYETRLNWKVWEKEITIIMKKMIEKNINKRNKVQRLLSDFVIPVYAINLRSRPDRLYNLKKQFESKPEFQVRYIKAVKNVNGAVGLWHSICKSVKIAQKLGEDVIILCEDDHEFTDFYDRDVLFANIIGAHKQGAELLNCGIGGFGNAVPISATRCWVDWFFCTQFVVIYASLFPKIISYNFKETDTADGVLSKLSTQSLIVYPPISRQKNYGYSDINPRESLSEFQNGIFSFTNYRLKVINDIYRRFHK